MSKRHINACTPDCDPDCGILYPHGYRPATAEEREQDRLRESSTLSEDQMVAFLRGLIATADAWAPMHYGSAEGAAYDEGQQAQANSAADAARDLLKKLGLPPEAEGSV